MSKGEPEHRERHGDHQRQHARRFVGAGKAEHREKVEQCAGAEENDQQPDRQIAIVRALRRDGKFRIGEGKIDDRAQPVALNLLGDEMAEYLGDREHAHRKPERLAADAAVKAVEKVSPIHRRNANFQSRSNSLMLVLARVFSSTRLTMTAHERLGVTPPPARGAPGRLPGTTTA